MPFAEWSDEFSVGVEEIDRDHKRLLGLLNDLQKAVEAGERREVLGKLLDELIHYTNYHFAHEEALFLRTNYPGYRAHERKHQALTDTAHAIREDFQLSASMALPRQVLEFVKYWLCEDILGRTGISARITTRTRTRSKPKPALPGSGRPWIATAPEAASRASARGPPSVRRMRRDCSMRKIFST